MRSHLFLYQPGLWLRVSLLAILTFALSGWTCTAVSCFGVNSAPQISSLSPNSIPASAQSVPLIVIGDNFGPKSQILWNGHALATTFVDSQHLQTSITLQTFQQFGGSQGTSVQIAVNSPFSTKVAGCPAAGNSATLVLVIN